MTSMGQRVIGCVCIIVSPWCFVHATTACHTWCNTIHSKRSSVAGPAVLPITICLLLIQIHMSIQRPMQHAFAVQCLDGDSQISFSSRWIRLRYALSNGPATVTQWINSYWANVQNWCFIMFHCTVFLCLTIHRCSNSSWVLGIHWHLPNWILKLATTFTTCSSTGQTAVPHSPSTSVDIHQWSLLKVHHDPLWAKFGQLWSWYYNSHLHLHFIYLAIPKLLHRMNGPSTLLRHLMDDVDPVELPAFGIPVAAPAKCAMATVNKAVTVSND